MERSTVGSLLRSTQAYCAQVCDRQTLTDGIAYYSERFAGLTEANQFREIIIDDPARIPAAYEEAERWFREHGLDCRCWAPADGRASDELSDFLVVRGFQRREYTAMALARWDNIEVADDVNALPARAMRAAFHRTVQDAESPSPLELRQLLVEAYDERLNDPQYDMFVALVDRQPAGRCALYQVGDIARLMDLTVLPPFAGRGVEAALTAHALALAKRLTMRNICVQVATDYSTRRTWFESAGFVEDGTIVEFHAGVSDDSGQDP